MSRSRNLFATAADLQSGFARLEAASDVRYVQCGLFDSRDILEFCRGSEIPELGMARSGNMNLESQYLVIERGSRVQVRSVPQRGGGTKYAIDQLENPDSTVFVAGGRFKDQVLISGRIATTGATSKAIDIHKLVVRTVTAGFRHVQAYWVGKEAYSMLMAGARLTPSATAPEIYDLRQCGAA